MQWHDHQCGHTDCPADRQSAFQSVKETMLITKLQLAGCIYHIRTGVLSSLRAGWHLGIVIDLTVHAVAWSQCVVTLKDSQLNMVAVHMIKLFIGR